MENENEKLKELYLKVQEARKPYDALRLEFNTIVRQKKQAEKAWKEKLAEYEAEKAKADQSQAPAAEANTTGANQ